MCHTSKEMRKTTNTERNRINKPRKNQNVRQKGNSQILQNIRSGQHQTSGDEKKKKLYQENEKITRNLTI